MAKDLNDEEARLYEALEAGMSGVGAMPANYMLRVLAVFVAAVIDCHPDAKSMLLEYFKCALAEELLDRDGEKRRVN